MPHPNLVILTGAGISAESGIRTFRASDGLWEDHRIEEVATPEGFARNPSLVQRFYDMRRAQLRDPAIAPNAGHLALAELEAGWQGEFLLVTQNVDNLHERAGSKRLLHMHGELQSMLCSNSQQRFPLLDDMPVEQACACCGLKGTLRPDIVWFGEMPYHMDRIEAALAEADLFAAIGTSGQVYPAAGFVAEVRGQAHTVELNLEPSEGARLFDEAHHGPATQVVPAWVDALLARWT